MLRRHRRAFLIIFVVALISAAGAYALAAGQDELESGRSPYAGVAPSGARYSLKAVPGRKDRLCVELKVQQPGGAESFTDECVIGLPGSASGIYELHCETGDFFVAGVLGPGVASVKLESDDGQSLVATPIQTEGPMRAFVLAADADRLPARIRTVGAARGLGPQVGPDLKPRDVCAPSGDESGYVAFGTF